MDASVQGALAQINQSWKAFSHDGKRMTKNQVEAILKYADQVGYTLVSQISDKEISEIIDKVNRRIKISPTPKK
jgi:hypothetical protein